MTNRMESLRTEVVAAIALAGWLVYGYWLAHIDLNAPFALNAVTAPAESAMQREQEPPLMFGEYPCGDDCSQNLAGYRWAREYGISDPDNCDGHTAAFIEGCRVYAEQRRVDVAAK